MSEYLLKPTVLVLNSGYYPIGTVCPKDAMIQVNGLQETGTVAKLIDVIWKKNPDGSINLEEFEYWQTCTFEEWVMAPIREIDKVIHTSKLQIRVPTVLVTSYSKIPMKRFRPNKTTLYNLQGGKCGYSGKALPFSQLNIEHKTPRSHGGKNTFQNLMVVDKKINFARGNKPMEELGLKPLFNHTEPRPIPSNFTIKNILHPDWKVFCGTN